MTIKSLDRRNRPEATLRGGGDSPKNIIQLGIIGINSHMQQDEKWQHALGSSNQKAFKWKLSLAMAGEILKLAAVVSQVGLGPFCIATLVADVVRLWKFGQST